MASCSAIDIDAFQNVECSPSLTVLLAGTMLLGSSLLVHLIWWRIALPKRQTRTLLVVFTTTPLVVVTIVAVAGYPLHLSISSISLVALFHASCALTYIALYSAIEQQSPTLAIVSRLSKSGNAGCTTDQLQASFGQEMPMENRLALMEQSAWLRTDGDQLRLTDEGRFFARLFDRAAQVFGLSKGG